MNITDDYIRGLVEAKGGFSFSSNGTKKIPTFYLHLDENDKELLEAVRDHLGLESKIYVNGPYKSSIGIQKIKARLVVREFGKLKNIIIPFFYNNLKGCKSKQFEEWLEKIGNDPAIHHSYRLLHRLHKTGYWNKTQSLK